MKYAGFDIETNPEPMGRGYQACLAGYPGHWSRGDNEYEAIGSLVKRLNVQAGGLPPAARRRLSDEQFRALLDLFMSSDPYPDTESNHAVIESLLHDESKARGYDNWIVAFHEFGTYIKER